MSSIGVTPLEDVELERAKWRLWLAERRFHEASGPQAIDEAIWAWAEAEQQFERRLREVRERFFHYGLLEWNRAASRSAARAGGRGGGQGGGHGGGRGASRSANRTAGQATSHAASHTAASGQVAAGGGPGSLVPGTGRAASPGDRRSIGV